MNKQIALAGFVILLVVIVVASLQAPLVRASNESASIEAADSSINLAFTNVLAAEKAGGNVTQLLARLNIAGDLLAEADNGYRSGNLANVTADADNARLIADQVNSDAISLLNASAGGPQNSFLLTLFFSVDGGLGFVFVLFLIWWRLKRGYMKKLRGLKHEVVESAA